jgi:transcriptional regulator with XRE-family HTH domain
MVIKGELTDQSVLAELGRRLGRYRLNQNLTQDQLAREAGVSKRTIVRLENGESSQLTNLVRVLRALGLLGDGGVLVPAPPTSPVAALKAKARERRRASPAGKKGEDAAKWTWGEEGPAGGGES